MSSAVSILLLFGILYGSALSKEERENNPDKFAKIIVLSMLTVLVLLSILFLFSYKTILETPEQMAYLFVGQSLFFLSTILVLVYSILNIHYG